MNVDRPSYANAAGEFVVDIYQPADNMVEQFPNGPYELSNYEVAVLETDIPRLMWPGGGIGFSVQYPGEKLRRVSFQKEWFSSVQQLVDYINIYLIPDDKRKSHIRFEFETFVFLYIKGAAATTFIDFDIAARDLFGFTQNKFNGTGTEWAKYAATGLPTLYDEPTRFLAITADFVSPIQSAGVGKQTLALAPTRADAAWGTFAARNFYAQPIYRRLQQTLLEKIELKICDPINGTPFTFNVRQPEHVKALVRLHFRPIPSKS